MARMLAAYAIGAALALVACGGSDTPEGTSREDFIAAADRVCSKANEQGGDVNSGLQALRSETDPQAAYTKMALLLGEAYDLQRAAQREFAALDPPAADKEAFDALNRVHEQQVALVGRLVEAAKRQDPAALASLNADLARVSAESQQRSKAFGFEKCGRGPA